MTFDATFAIDGWDEAPVDDRTPKITNAHVQKTFSGDITGTSQMEYVMSYAEDGTASVVGLERLTCEIGDREGTIVIRHVGGFDGGAATADLLVVPEAGSGDFEGVSGNGTMKADPSGSMTLDLGG